MPYSAVFLGIAGLIPFVAMPLAYQLNLLSLTQSAVYFVQYSAVLLSFFGGIHWWDAISNQRYDKQMLVAMLPTIIGWLCLVFSHDVKVFGVLSLSYVAVLIYDKFILSLPKEQIVSYISLRMVLDSLIELHKVDYKKAGLEHLGKGAGYIERQISGWSERYSKAKTWNVPSGKKIMRWLENHMPANERICITHNDFRFDNVVLKPDNYTQIIGVLDWELATLGDPLMDLGNTLAYWVQADDDFLAQSTRRQPTHLPGMLTRKQVVAYYCKEMEIDVDDFTFYEVYGLFRLAGIAQQIYYRYHHKQTNNPAFKNFWIFIHYLMWRCNKAIKASGKR